MWEDDKQLQTNTYTLPEIQFVGGSEQIYNFNLKTASGNVFDGIGYSANFSIIHYSNKNGTPVISKTVSTTADTDGKYSIVKVTLTSSETVALNGQYIYQITIVDIDKEAEIPNQGIMHITSNINKSYITSL